MPDGEGITRELSFGEVFSKTFDLYRRDFAKYLVVFVVVEAIIGVLTALVTRTFVLPTLPANPTSQDVLAWLPGFFNALFYLVALNLLVTFVFYPLANGSSIKMATQAIEKGQADLGGSVRFIISKLPWIWALSIITGIIVGLGFIALIIPGIILAIMFCLAIPALLIENTGVLESMGRSRKLVSHRWLKTFALGIVLIIIIIIAAIIVSLISAPFGVASSVVSSILSAFYSPLVPIFLTVYYFSNVARLAPPPVSQTTVTPAAAVQAETKFCPRCGTQMPSWASVCPKCGAQQSM
jgi:ribosomal protein L40E